MSETPGSDSDLIAFMAARLDEAERDPGGDPWDIEADRRLLHQFMIANALMPGQYKLGYCEAFEEVIKIRAGRFANHPDYRPEWVLDAR